MEGWITNTVKLIEENAASMNIALLSFVAILLTLILILMLIRAAQSGEIIREIQSIRGSVSTLQNVIERDIYKIREYTSETALNTQRQNGE
jgi:hypothetical protein